MRSRWPRCSRVAQVAVTFFAESQRDLACLRDCGLVASRPQGRASMWSLASAPQIMAVLAAAEGLLAATGDAVALCPRYGTDAAR